MTNSNPLRITANILLLCIFSSIALAQIKSTSADTREKDLPDIYHCGEREDLSMSLRDKRCYWWTHSFNGTMVSGAIPVSLKIAPSRTGCQSTLRPYFAASASIFCAAR